MSARVKFTENSANLTKISHHSLSPSSVKSGKCKSILAVLTPSRTKQWLKKNKNKSIQESVETIISNADDTCKDLEASSNLSEPGYCSIPDVQISRPSYEIPSVKLNKRLSESSQGSSQQFVQCYDSKPNSVSTINDEPLYATVNKQNLTGSSSNVEDSPNKSIIEDQKEEIRGLVERLKELTNENRELHKNIETIMKEQKWKEDSLHAELKLEITQLEAQTHKQVKCLTEQIQNLQTERTVLTNQVQVLHDEKKALQQKYEELYRKSQAMVSSDFLQKTVDDHEKFVKELKKKFESEIKKLKEQNEAITESKILLTIQLDSLKEEIKDLKIKNESLKNSEEELLQEKSRLMLQIEKSNEMQQELQTMLNSLLKVTENIATERDILLNKTNYQDHQQKLLQTSIVDYSMNMGRLQEHISNLSKAKLEEIQKIKNGEIQRDEKIKTLYNTQLDQLQSKVLNQNDTINDLQSEKSKLELQLESLWQSVCLGKPQLEEIKFNIY